MTASPLSRLVAKNTVSQVTAVGLSWGSKAVAMVLVARALGPDGLGVFSVAWTVASILSFLAPLGLGTLLVRELSRKRTPDDLETALPLATLLGLAFAGALVAGAVLWPTPDETSRTLVAAGAFVALSAPVLVFRAALHARERMEIETAAMAIEGAVALGVLVAALASGGGVVAAMLALAAGRAANLIASFAGTVRLWGRPRLRLDAGRWLPLLRTSLPMGLAYLFTTVVLRFDIVLLGVLRPAAEVGIYSAASVLVMAVPVVATGLAGSLYPAMSRTSGPTDPELARITSWAWRLLVGFGFGAAGAVVVAARPIVGFVYGDGFGEAAWVLAALAVVLPLRFANALLGYVLNAIDRERRRTLVVGVAAGFNLAANLALIPVLGYRGAVLSTLATDVLFTVGLLWAIRPLDPGLLRPVVNGVALAAATGGAVALTPGHVVLKGAVAGGILAAWTVLRNRRREDTGPESALTLAVGPVDVRLEELDRLGPRSRRWIAGSLAPLAAPPRGTPAATIRFDDVPAAPDRLARVDAAPAGDGVISVCDHAGRAARIPLADLGTRAIVVDGSVDPRWFENAVWLPTVRAALRAADAVLVRGTAVETGGRRIAMTGWAKTGKTRILIEVLRRGGKLVGDDWFALGSDGTVWPVTASLALRKVHASRLSGRTRRLVRGRLPHAHELAVRTLARASELLSGAPTPSRILRRLADLGSDAGSVQLGVAEAVPGTELASPGRLDGVVVLLGPGQGEPAPGDLTEILAAQAAAHQEPHTDLEAAYRYLFPGRLTVSPFGRPGEETRTLDTGLAGVPMTCVTPGEPPAVADIVAGLHGKPQGAIA